MDKKLKVIFVGTPDMALVCLSNLIEAKFDIAAVIPPLKDNETYSYFKNYVISKKLNLVEFDKTPNEKEYIEKLKEIKADIGVVCSYNVKLSKDFLNTTKMGYINCHPSLLPEYRGAAPYFHIVKNGEKVSGVTLHYMDENFDTGDIIYQESFNLIPNETSGTIFNRTNYMLSDALVKTLKIIEQKGNIEKISQPKNCYKEAIRVNGNFKINFEKDVYETECLIRACNPFYNARTIFRQTSMKIIDARAIIQNHSFAFGEIVQAQDNQLLVAAKNGFLSINILSIGTWGVFSAYDFNYIFSPKTGEKLG